MSEDVTPAETAAPESGADPAQVQELLSEMGATPKGEDSVELFGQEDGTEESASEPSVELQAPEEDKVTASPKRTTALQKIIDEKYKGDEEAFAKSLIEQQNTSSDMRKELNELKELLQSFRKEKDAVEAGEDPITSDPDVQWLVEQKGLIDQDVQKLQAMRGQLVDEYSKAQKAIDKLDGKIEVADEYDKEKFLLDRARLEQYQKQLTDTWNDLPNQEKRLEWSVKDLDRKIEAAKREARSRAQTQKTLEVQRAAERQAWRDSLESNIGKVAEQNGVSVDSKQFRTLKKYIWNDIYARLSSMDPNAPGLNAEEAVISSATEYFESLGQQNKAAFQAKSNQKLAATSPRTPTPNVKPSGPAKVVSKENITPEMARKHAKAIMERL